MKTTKARDTVIRCGICSTEVGRIPATEIIVARDNATSTDALKEMECPTCKTTVRARVAVKPR